MRKKKLNKWDEAIANITGFTIVLFFIGIAFFVGIGMLIMIKWLISFLFA